MVSVAKLSNVYVYKTEESEFVCAPCTGKTLWSGPYTTSEQKSPCAVCLVDTYKKEYEIASQCSECSAISVPPRMAQNIVCSSCPQDVLKANKEAETNFLIIEGEPKCEDCALQANFQK